MRLLSRTVNVEFGAFAITRLAGVIVKPLVIFVAGFVNRDDFANHYALLVSALAGLFVLSGAQTHIDFYKKRFSRNSIGYTHAYLRYFRETGLQYGLVLPFIAILGLLWTNETIILIAIVTLVGVEKFFDEDMRYFQFTKEYLNWSISFAFRAIIPGLLAVILLIFYKGDIFIYYMAFCLSSFIMYLGLRYRHARVYAFYAIKGLQALANRPLKILAHFANRWRGDLAFNQAWTFASINIILVDRMLIANIHPSELHVYVFFANVFNLINVAHSLFYFTPRRPELIKIGKHSGQEELLRLGNLLPPIAYATISFGVAVSVRYISPAYHDVSFLLFVGFAALYFFQAINQVGVEYTFWRVSRLKLVACDGTLIVLMSAAIYTLQPRIELIPFVIASGLLLRIIAYQFLSFRANAKSNIEKLYA